jgi:ParB family chromosome partitioning protein
MKDQLAKLLGIQDGDIKDANVIQVEIDKIETNPYQPRTAFDEDALNELKESILRYGVIQPVLLRKMGNTYQLIAGERRLRATQLAGIKTIPAIVRKLSDEDAGMIALIENLQRKDLDFLEEAEGYKKMIEQFQMTQEEMAKRLGKSQAYIANKIRLLNLPPRVKKLIEENRGIITERHARALLKIKDENLQEEVLIKIICNRLTVRETDELVDGNISREIKQQKVRNRQKIKKVIRDMRIYLNSIDQIIKEMKQSGIDAQIEKEIKESTIEIKIKING